MKRKCFVAIAMAACMLGVTACGGGKEEAKKEVADVHYVLAEAGSELGEGTGAEQVCVKDDSIYYLTYNEATYPEEYEKEMEELYNKFFPEGSDSVIGRDKEAAEESTSEESVTEETTAKEGTEDKKKDDEATDDDLLGDMDDLFGEGNTDDSSTDDNSDDATDNATDNAVDDDMGVMSDTPSFDPYENKEYVEQMKVIEEKYAQYAPTYDVCKSDTKGQGLTKLFPVEMKDSYVTAMGVSKEGDIVLVFNGNNYDEATGKYTYTFSVKTYAEDGTEKSSADFSDKFSDKGDEFYIGSTILDNQGNVYLTCGENGNNSVIYKFDVTGKDGGSVSIDKNVDELVLDNENNVIISCYGEKGIELNYVDFEKSAIGDALEDVVNENEYIQLISGSGSSTLYLKDNTALYSYDKTTKERKEIIKWLESGVVSDTVQKLIPLADGNFVCLYMLQNGDNWTSKIGLITQSDEQVVQKEVIKIASMYSDPAIQQKIVEYNKTNDKYKIEFKSYENSEDPQSAMVNDIVAGNVPDIMETSYMNMDALIAKGMFEDLTPYMEKDDTINKDYFVDGIYDKFVTDGKVYSIAKTFSIMTVVGSNKEVGKFKDGWTMEELIDFYKSKPEGTLLFDYSDKQSMLYNFIISDIGKYIDWNSGKCSFDGEEFKKALEFCNEFPSETNYEEIEQLDMVKAVKEGKVLLGTSYISDTETLQYNSKIFGEDVVYVGYPSSQGKGTYINFASRYGISSSSKNKDEAWNIIKSVFEADDNNRYTLLTSKSEFEKIIKRDTATEKYVDEDGNEVLPRDTSYGMNNTEIKLGPSTELEIQTLRDLIKEAKIASNNSSIATIIEQDIQQYFDGSKTIDEITKIIQDKLSKYVNENK